MKIKPMNNYGMQTVTTQARGGVNLHTHTFYQAVELLAYVIRFLAHFVGYLAQAGLLIFITPPLKMCTKTTRVNILAKSRKK